MTIGRTSQTPTGVQQGWNHEGNEIPIRYQVIARKERIVTLVPRRTVLDYLWGQIVTHLSVEDYCKMHGLVLERVLGTREALKDERTELF